MPLTFRIVQHPGLPHSDPENDRGELLEVYDDAHYGDGSQAKAHIRYEPDEAAWSITTEPLTQRERLEPTGFHTRELALAHVLDEVIGRHDVPPDGDLSEEAEREWAAKVDR